MSRSAFRALPKVTQARALSVAGSGAGSIAARPDGSLVVEIRLADTTAATRAALGSAGARVFVVDPHVNMVSATVQPSALQAVAAVPGVLSVMEVLRPARSAACPTGIVSEGVQQLKVDTARTVHGVDGTGVTVGVLSDSYDNASGAATDVTNGELPGTTNPCGSLTPVAVQSDFVAPQGQPAGGDEGRAMAQVVHDVAPGAAIRFATAENGELAFAQQIRDLATAGAGVIVDDLTCYNEPMYQDGLVGKAVEDVTAAGVAYFSSAGNNNENFSGHDVASYETPAFRPMACPASVVAIEGNPSGLTCHNFNGDPNGVATAQYGLHFTAKDFFILGWNEPQFGVATDLDLFLLDGSGTAVANSGDTNSATGRAYEALVAPKAGSYSLVVARFAGSGTPRFKLVDQSGSIDTIPTPALAGGDIAGPASYGHNMSRSGASVAAMSFDTTAAPEYYSSRGPMSYCWGPSSAPPRRLPSTPART